ncbi:hypothetical protein PVAP13_6NG180709, partial [Panicum virgatum]
SRTSLCFLVCHSLTEPWLPGLLTRTGGRRSCSGLLELFHRLRTSRLRSTLLTGMDRKRLGCCSSRRSTLVRMRRTEGLAGTWRRTCCGCSDGCCLPFRTTTVSTST